MRSYLRMTDEQLQAEIDRGMDLRGYLNSELKAFSDHLDSLTALRAKLSEYDGDYFEENDMDTLDALLCCEIHHRENELLVISEQISQAKMLAI